MTHFPYSSNHNMHSHHACSNTTTPPYNAAHSPIPRLNERSFEHSFTTPTGKVYFISQSPFWPFLFLSPKHFFQASTTLTDNHSLLKTVHNHRSFSYTSQIPTTSSTKWPATHLPKRFTVSASSEATTTKEATNHNGFASLLIPSTPLMSSPRRSLVYFPQITP